MLAPRAHMALRGSDMRYPVYSRAEVLADAVLHIAGITAASLAVPVMVTLSAIWYGDPTTVGAAIVYGVGLIAMLTVSASYHLIPCPSAKAILRRFDHAAIYVKIAATYTPFAVLLAGSQAVSILAAIWSAALLGLMLKLVAPRRVERFSLTLYLAMGWAIVVIGGPILDGVSPAGLTLMVTGGGLYTLGIGVLALQAAALPQRHLARVGAGGELRLLRRDPDRGDAPCPGDLRFSEKLQFATKNNFINKLRKI